jgi:hypothetical protein
MFDRLLRRQPPERRLLPPEISESYRLTEALRHIRQRWPEACPQADDEPVPVFILAAGWGSGSTLLQRLILSSGEIALWGEPFDIAVPIQRLSLGIAAVRADWPEEENFVRGVSLQEYSAAWSGSIMPPVEIYRAAHRAFLKTWLGSLSDRGGPSRWGLKEVRLTIHHARYLKWLFPTARFVFIYRDLYRCYLSAKRGGWYSVWPSHKVKPPAAFAHHWRWLLEGFLDGYKELDGLLIKYEDVVSGQVSLDDLARHVRVQRIDPEVLQMKIGSRSAGRELSRSERSVLASIGGPLRARLGYG